VVINNLDIFRVPVTPSETDTPLIVDPDAVLAGAVTCQSLKPITRREPQVVKPGRGVQIAQFPASCC
jgi:hypothetical protein